MRRLRAVAQDPKRLQRQREAEAAKEAKAAEQAARVAAHRKPWNPHTLAERLEQAERVPDRRRRHGIRDLLYAALLLGSPPPPPPEE